MNAQKLEISHFLLDDLLKFHAISFLIQHLLCN